MSAALTPEQSAYFDACMVKWQERLNLQNWRIERSKKAAAPHALASVTIEVPDRLASYKVGKWDTPTDRDLDSTALHEALHVFLAPYKFAISKDLGEDAVMSEEHAIVVFLERLLMKDAT